MDNAARRPPREGAQDGRGRSRRAGDMVLGGLGLLSVFMIAPASLGDETQEFAALRQVLQTEFAGTEDAADVVAAPFVARAIEPGFPAGSEKGMPLGTGSSDLEGRMKILGIPVPEDGKPGGTWAAERDETGGVLGPASHTGPFRFATATGAPNKPGPPVQPDVILIQFEPSADAAAIRDVLARNALAVRSMIPEIGLVLASPAGPARSPSPQGGAVDVQALVAERDQLVEVLRRDPRVRSAALNGVLSTPSIPTGNGIQFEMSGGVIHEWSWRPPKDGDSPARRGNWGHFDIRLPQAWSFNDAIRRRGSTAVRVGIVDAGFAPHPDLEYTVLPQNRVAARSHGVWVLGVMAATFDNGIGIDGVSPFADVLAASAPDFEATEEVPQIYLVLSEVIRELTLMIDSDPPPKVINLSLGYNWMANHGINPDFDVRTQEEVKAHGIIVHGLASFARSHGILLVTAAGNDSNGFPQVSATYASPFNWAASNGVAGHGPARNILVVESYDGDRRLSNFSNIGGTYAAPGEEILTTNLQQDLPQSSFVASSSAASDPSHYILQNGTSFAAPFLTGVIANLYAYNPSLTPDDVLDILTKTTDPTTGFAPRLDAFAAMVAARPDALADLADLSGDGVVDRADLALFEKAVGIGETLRNGTAPDGAADQEGLRLFMRADLNGDGAVSAAPDDRAAIAGRQLSDVDVLLEAWADPDLSAAAARSRLMALADSR